MNHNETNIQDLLNLLYSWQTLSAHFREELVRSIRLQPVFPKQELCREGSYVNSAWYSIDCWVIGYQSLSIGTEEVSTIHPPKTLFTEPQSFLQQKPSKQRLQILEGNGLLSLDRRTFNQLRNHPETQLLLEHYLLLDNQEHQWRMDILAMRDIDKVVSFAERYPLNQLPGNLVASFLRMTQAHFSTIKSNYNRGL